MVNFNAKKVLLGLGFVALAASANADWSNVTTKYVKNPAFIPGWAGALTATADGVGEAWDAPFEIYQVVNDAPAGEYTLTATAYFRYGTNDFDKAYEGVEGHDAYLYLGSAKVALKHLYLGGTVESAPNGTGDANNAFQTDLYLNTVKFNHPGGDLRLGIGTAEYRQDQWCCFDNFKLVGPNGEVALVNGDFSQGIENDNGVWDMDNISGSKKTVDINKDGGANGCYRKTNASPYHFGQLVELPAGKYRWGVQSFFRHGNGNQSGWYIKLKGFERIEGASAYDAHLAGTEDTSLNPILYVAEDKLDGFKPLDNKDINDIKEGNGVYAEVPVKCIFDEQLDVYPDNEPKTETVQDGQHGYCDSGYENEAAQCFLNNPDKYRNYVTFELTAPTKVWLGLKKDVNAPSNYWHPFRDFTLEVDNGGAGVDGIATDVEDAPAEYYNLQGIRVAEPANGIFIVRKGNKSEKVMF